MNLNEKITYNIDKFFSFIDWLFFGEPIYSTGNKSTYVGLYGFLRLRVDPNPGGDIVPEINNCALVRELHIYGQSMGVGKNGVGSQHRGYGMKLMKIAEEIAAYNNYKKVAVIAGVGTREYYKNKCGYSLNGTYMLKEILKYNYKFLLRLLILISIFIPFLFLISLI